MSTFVLYLSTADEIVFVQFVQVFYQTHSSDAVIGRYSAACLHTMRLTKVSAKKYSCSSMEIAVSHNEVIIIIILC